MTTATDRAKLLRDADRLLAANDNRPQEARVRFRGSRPAWNWLAKHDAHGAACLWLVMRQRLPQPANDNCADAVGLSLDRRKGGKVRGRDPAPQNLEAYLALPPAKPRLGSSEPIAPALRGWFGWFEIKPQPDEVPFHNDCRFGFGPPAIAQGAFFLGAQSGVGQPRPYTRHGDVRRTDSVEFAMAPPEVDTVIEAVLARATLHGVGEALGARGGYADRRGRKGLMEAARWAKAASPMQQQV
ncbi:hypothetical protein EB230_20825 [Mesorhizobium sp. NZP2234]|nr:hypothetical protein EB230_20825 [Mesorhizobium sp. NZP2234]